MEADPTRLEQIVVNLLANAAKYTEKGGEISLRARKEDDQIVVRVRDNGVGIPPEKLPLMFELFAQGDRTLARSEGGLGIGLTLVRSLVARCTAAAWRRSARGWARGASSSCACRRVPARRPPRAMSVPARPTAVRRGDGRRCKSRRHPPPGRGAAGAGGR